MTRCALLVLLLTSTAHADGSEAPVQGAAAAETTPNRFNLRIGAATTDSNGHPTLCLDVRVWRGLGVESCGTGQAVLHDDPGYEMAHFRATWSLVERAMPPGGTVRLRGGVGWAEMQVGVDHPGFRFNTLDGDRGSVAGPEASVQGQWLMPLGGGIEAVGSATIGAAVFASANQLVIPQDRLQPFASFEVGLGW